MWDQLAFHAKRLRLAGFLKTSACALHERLPLLFGAGLDKVRNSRVISSQLSNRLQAILEGSSAGRRLPLGAFNVVKGTTGGLPRDNSQAEHGLAGATKGMLCANTYR